jgi:hypothetical protein
LNLLKTSGRMHGSSSKRPRGKLKIVVFFCDLHSFNLARHLSITLGVCMWRCQPTPNFYTLSWLKTSAAKVVATSHHVTADERA